MTIASYPLQVFVGCFASTVRPLWPCNECLCLPMKDQLSFQATGNERDTRAARPDQ